MIKMDWNLVQSFLAVADAGTLIKAAEKIKVSQPTLGRHIGDLEEAMGLSLFIRGRSGMKLTEAGLSLVEDARRMAEQAQNISLKAAGQVSSLKGTVRLTASDVVSAYFLPAILTRLRSAEPEIDIELVSSNQVDNLLSRDADIAVRMVRPEQNDLIARKVTDIAMGSYASQAYLTVFGTPATPEELLTHRLIGFDRNDLILRYIHSLGYQADRTAFAFRTDAQVVNWELVKAGAGIGFGGQYLASLTPDLVRVLPDLHIPSLPVWLASHQDLRTSLRIRRVMDFLYESLSALPLSGFQGPTD